MQSLGELLSRNPQPSEFREQYENLPVREQHLALRRLGVNPTNPTARARALLDLAKKFECPMEWADVVLAGLGEMPADAQPEPIPPGRALPSHPNMAPYAWWVPIAQVRTDPRRFQNRTDAFSELSADAVAATFDANKFDPVVIWIDPRDQKTYMLSGHSRLEGMRRRGEPRIPARYFNGTEAEAIQFARVDANRAATAESFIEDLKAYKLMRDGDPARGLEPASKTELRNSFKGKVSKLAAYANLAPAGKFIAALGESDRSLYPYIETRAQWTGELREQYPELTDVHERDIFDWLYSENGGLKLPKAEFLRIVEERILLGKERLFPECRDGVCAEMADVSQAFKSQKEKALFKELEETEAAIRFIEERFRSRKEYGRVHTEPEKDALRSLLESYKADKKRLQSALNIAERMAEDTGLFGLGRAARYDRYPAHLRDSWRRFDELLALKDALQKRLRATDLANKVYTPAERNMLTRLLREAETERLRLADQLHFVQKEVPLFG